MCTIRERERVKERKIDREREREKERRKGLLVIFGDSKRGAGKDLICVEPLRKLPSIFWEKPSPFWEKDSSARVEPTPVCYVTVFNRFTRCVPPVVLTHTHTCTRKKEREKYGSTPTHIIYGCRVFPDFSLCVEYIYSHSHTLKCVALSAHEAGILCSESPLISIFLLHITKRGGVFNFMLLLTFAKQACKPSKRTVLLLCKKDMTWLQLGWALFSCFEINNILQMYFDTNFYCTYTSMV